MDRVTQLAGWYTYVTEGRILSITASQDIEGDVLWMLIDRGTFTTLEVYRPNVPVPEYLDSYVRVSVGNFAVPTGGDYNEAHSDAYDIEATDPNDKPRVNIAGNPWGDRYVSCYILKPDGRRLQHRDIRRFDDD